MPKIIQRTLSGTLSVLRNHRDALISLAESARSWGRVHPSYQKLSPASARDAASSEGEGLGAAYDKRKWVEAYYGTPDKAAPVRIKGGRRRD